MVELDDTTWAEIRVAYETSDLSVSAIVTRYGTTAQRLYERRRREGWTLRSQMPPAGGAGSSGRARPGGRFGHAAVVPEFSNRALMSRMMRLAERNLSMMEKYMSDEGKRTAEDCERSTRTVGTLVKTLEKVTELQPPDDDTSVTSEMASNATAELRRELAERLFRMWGGAKR